MDLIFITPTLVVRTQAVVGWGIVLHSDGVRELHIFLAGFGMVHIPGPDMGGIVDQLIAAGLARPASRWEVSCPPASDLAELRLDHP